MKKKLTTTATPNIGLNFTGQCFHDWSEFQQITINGVFIIFQQCQKCKLINKL